MDFKIKNFTIEKFNNDVNSSGSPDRKYADWKEYRAEVSRFISDNTAEGKRENLFVFGAGECNDIDLAFLTSVFDSIVLSDIDLMSVEDGIKRQQLDKENEDKISKQKQEYSGLEKVEFFESISKMAGERAGEEDIAEYIRGIKSISRVMGNQSSKKYDTVLVLPTYTQIAFTQMEALLRILYEYKIYQLDALNRILNEMYQVMPNILENYNRMVLSKVKDGGKVIVLTDILEITDSKTMDGLKENIENEEYIRDYTKENYSELALLGLDDIKQSLNITNERYCMWPFDDSRQYLVLLTSGIKK